MRNNDIRSRKPRKLIDLGPDTRVATLVEASPAALAVLLEMGFTPLRNPVARRTVARMFTLAQAAAFRGLEVEPMLAQLRRVVDEEARVDLVPEIAADSESPAAETTESQPEVVVPELAGDVRAMGLVPCPVRSILVERFDAFAQKFSASTGSRLAWWLAGGGVATKDVRQWLANVAAAGEPDRIPDVLTAVGTELFFHPQLGALARSGLLQPFPGRRHPRSEFAPLEDPGGILGPHFCVPFALACRRDRLPNGRLPETWADLSHPDFEGEVALPPLDLPVVPDLLAALHAHLGEHAFRRFAANVAVTMHPAQASPRSRRGEVPAAVILPMHFAKSAEATGGVCVLPEGRPVAVPAFIGVRADAKPEAVEVANFLCSKTFLHPLWAHGGFLPNSTEVDAQMPKGGVISRPWAPILAGDAVSDDKRIMAMFDDSLRVEEAA